MGNRHHPLRGHRARDFFAVFHVVVKVVAGTTRHAVVTVMRLR